MTNVLGLRIEQHGRETWFRTDDNRLAFALWKPARLHAPGAVAAIFVYGWTQPKRGVSDIVLVDEQGTEVWPWMVGAPGYWCWLLDLAVEAGLEW